MPASTPGRGGWLSPVSRDASVTRTWGFSITRVTRCWDVTDEALMEQRLSLTLTAASEIVLECSRRCWLRSAWSAHARVLAINAIV